MRTADQFAPSPESRILTATDVAEGRYRFESIKVLVRRTSGSTETTRTLIELTADRSTNVIENYGSLSGLRAALQIPAGLEMRFKQTDKIYLFTVNTIDLSLEEKSASFSPALSPKGEVVALDATFGAEALSGYVPKLFLGNHSSQDFRLDENGNIQYFGSLRKNSEGFEIFVKVSFVPAGR